MAFTGVAIVKQVSDREVRITGVSLASEGGAGTIGLFEKDVAPDVRLPAGFQPREYDNPDAAAKVTLQDSIKVTFNYKNAGATAQAISTVKTGTTPDDFVVTMTNNAAIEGGNSGELEIFVEYH